MATADSRHRRTLALFVSALLLGGPAATIIPAAASAEEAVVVVGTDASATAAAVAAAGGRVDRVLDVIGGVSARLTEVEQNTIEAKGLRVAPDAPAKVTSTGFDKQGDLVQLAALNPSSNNRGAGAGVGVALIDTGVSESPELGDRVLYGPDLSGEDDGSDTYGHGTFMAGLIIGEETGIAPAAHLMSVKVAGADGSTMLSTVLEAMDFVVETRDEVDTRILSMSLAVDPFGPWYVDPLALATEYVTSKGILVVTASGNTGGVVSSPGISPSALTVGASDANDTATQSDDVVTSWSGSAGSKPEVVAPGEAIVSVRVPGSTIDTAYPAARIGSNHFRGSGTSMSTALTAGAAAVIAEQAPDATPTDLKSMIVNGARPITGGKAVDLRGAEKVAAETTVVPTTPVADDGTPITWTGTRWAGTRWAGTRWAGTRWAALAGRALVGPGPAGRALAGPALAGRALVGRALVGRALVGRALAGRVPVGLEPAGRQRTSEWSASRT